MASVIGIDVGGTTIKAARFGVDGEPTQRASLPTPPGPEVAAAVCDVARRLRCDDLAGVGVVVPGVVDRAAGVVRYAANVGWRDMPLRRLVQDELAVPVTVEHDVTAAALAEEAVVGGALFYVGLGTGVGGAFVADGVALRGATGLAGELGHIPVHPDGEPCPCGQRGCLEVYASAAAIARRYIRRGGAAGSTSADVAARLDTDAEAARAWTDAVEALGLALAAATLLLDPARIVLGGGLAGSGELLAQPTRAALAGRLAWRPAPALDVSALGPDAGVRGAALLANQAAERVGAS
jgi:glucokinase